MKRKFVLTVVLATALAACSHAQASTLSFTLSGADNYSWLMDSNPTPDVSISGSYTLIFGGPGGAINGGLVFWSVFTGGGIVGFDPAASSVLLFDLVGPQIYTGAEGAPVFAPGIFTGLNPGNASLTPGTDTLTVSDVTAATDTTPLPAALPLFVFGLAGLGWLARRRKEGCS